MGRKHLDDRSADRLVAGLTTADDAPPGYAGVADLLRAARSAPPVPLGRETMTVARMKAVIAELPVPVPAAPLAAASRRTWREVVRSGTARATAATAALLIVGATGAAAATGSLPAPAQEATHDVLAHLSVTVPGPASRHHGQPAGTAPTPVGPASGPDAHATFGLCTAAAAADGHPATESAVPVTSSQTCRPPDDTVATSSSSGPRDTGDVQAGTAKPDGSEGHAAPSTPAAPDHTGARAPDAQPQPADHTTPTTAHSDGHRSSGTSLTDSTPTLGHP